MNYSQNLVVLIHGISEPRLVLAPLEIYLKTQGYDALNIEYPWQDTTIDRLTGSIHKNLVKNGAFKAPCLHFVTHSMGGLVLRSYLSRYKPENLGKVVMLAPPYKGSEFADLLHENWLYKFYYGPAGQELTTAARSGWNDQPVDFELGVVAGDNSLVKAINGSVISGPNDGVVSVESTKIPGMKDHVVIDAIHAAIVASPAAWRQICAFLGNGAFVKV